MEATFFLVGENVETYPDIVKRIYEEGHLIGNHTYHRVEDYRNFLMKKQCMKLTRLMS
ncbi:MAG: polysaccharide deacetylase family protein [Dorea sp.]